LTPLEGLSRGTGGWAIIFYFPEGLLQSLWEIKNYCPPSTKNENH